MSQPRSDSLLAELAALRHKLQEVEATLEAIRRGEVDALVVSTEGGPRVFTLEGAEQPYRIFVESMDQGALTVTPEGLVSYSNERFAALLKIPLEQVPGTSVLRHVALEDQAKWRALFSQAKREGRSGGELTLAGREGDRVPTCVALRTLQLKVPTISIIVTDLSEQKRSRERDAMLVQEHMMRLKLQETIESLRLSEERFRVALAGSPISVFNQDQELRYTWIRSPAGGGIPEDLLGKTDSELVSSEETRRLEAIKRSVLRSGQRVREEVLLHLQGKEPSWFDLIVDPLHDSDGKIVGITGAVLDITVRRLAEKSLEERDRQKDLFLSVLGHELRNPLEFIQSAVEVLQILGPSEPRLVRARQAIAEQVSLMARLLDDLLDVSRISHGKIELRHEQVDLVGLLRNVVETHAAEANAKDISVCFGFPEGPLWMRGDPVRLAQIFGNLITNAVKFTHPQDTVEVTLDVDRGAERVAVCVRDSGVGLDEAALARVFEPFYQGEKTRTRAQGGLGLGLALVKGLVELHGGTVTASSAGVGRGAEFRVELPIGCADPAAVEAPAAQRSRQGYRLLIVDDYVDAAKMMRLVLELLGHEVETASSGSAGIEAARRFKPNVVLCDIGLPDMDGYAVARACRADPLLASVPLVALTGYGRDVDRARAEAAGFSYHLTKPVTAEAVETALAALALDRAPDVATGRRSD